MQVNLSIATCAAGLWVSAICHEARAQSCTFSMPDIDFGTVDLTAGAATSTSVNFGYSCTGTGGQTVRICPNINTGSGGANAAGSARYMLYGSNQLIYNIYSNSTYSTVWGSYTWGRSPTPPTISMKLPKSGSGSGSFTARARVPSGQNSLPVGVYTSSFQGAETRINYAYSTVGNCSTISSSNRNPTQVPFTVKAATGAICSIVTTDVDFGTQTLLNSNVDASNTISVICPSGVPYVIGLGGGVAGAVQPTQRAMTNGTDDIIYGIYTNSTRTLGWGNTAGVNTVSGTGSGSYQTYTAYSRIPPQPTPPADIYEDSIVVTVTY